MDYFAAANAYAHSHPYLLTAGAFALAHWKLAVKLLFKVKPLRAVVVGNPTEAHQWIADLKAEVDADIDEAVADSKAHAVPAAPAA